jgi:transcription antitermination factor NusG
MTCRHARCRAELERAGFEAYTPLIKEKKTIRGRRRWLIGYLFGRYFFIRKTERWSEILGIRYIDDMIRHDNGLPPLIADLEIAALRSREVSGFINVRTGFRNGQLVRVRSGPFMGQIGTFAGLVSRGDREAALFEFMGQRSRIEFAPGVLAAA